MTSFKCRTKIVRSSAGDRILYLSEDLSQDRIGNIGALRAGQEKMAPNTIQSKEQVQF